MGNKKNQIADYFSNKALDVMDDLSAQRKISTSTVESWATEHTRTPYIED